MRGRHRVLLRGSFVTIIIAAVAPRVAIIAADSLRSGDDGSRRTVCKIRSLSDRVVVAKGGYGDLADGIWAKLLALPAETRANPHLVADAIEVAAQPIYDICKKVADEAGAADFGLYFIVAGLGPDSRGVVITINVGTQDRKPFYSDDGIRVVGLGSTPEAGDLARTTANASGDPLDPRKWVAAAVHAGEEEDPTTIGFPAHGWIIRSDSVEQFTILEPGKNDLPNP